ncbi:MAG: NDP-sugar synthase [Actinobacteria bacterium]|nr:NDP-sugar synthase [Actinomycetota bacterium]
MIEAILLVGGQGTRLRPLTISTPKPMLPVAGFPCTEHQISRAKEAGIGRIILGTSYRAEVFEEYFDHGQDAGVELVYAVEDEPLGTGGAIRNAANHLTCGPDDPVVIFNGDVLTGLDIAGLIEKWREAEADVALYLTRVEDPRAYGLVPTDETGRVLEFREKPTTPEEIVTDQINAGCYVFRRSVIDSIPDGVPVSVERETFPALLNSGATVIGVVDEGYWLDLGTPLAFAQGSADLVLGNAPSPLVAGNVGDSFVDSSAQVSPTAILRNGTYVGPGATIGDSAIVDASVIFPDVVIGENSIVTKSIVSAGAVIGTGVVITEAVIAELAIIGDRSILESGARVFPGESVEPASTVKAWVD